MFYINDRLYNLWKPFLLYALGYMLIHNTLLCGNDAKIYVEHYDSKCMAMTKV